MHLTIRHFTGADVPLRTALMRDPDFQANIADIAALAGDDELAKIQLRTIAEEQDTKRIFTVCRGDEVVGFWWLSAIDWPGRTGELSFALLPRFRHFLGLHLIEEAQGYLHDELNIEVIVDRVLEHNVMLHSRSRLAHLSAVRAEYNQFTTGRWCTILCWTRTAKEFRVQDREIAVRRAERAGRIRAELARSRSAEQ